MKTPSKKTVSKKAPNANIGNDIEEWVKKQMAAMKKAGANIESDLSRRGQAFLNNTKFDEGFSLMKKVMTKKKR